MVERITDENVVSIHVGPASYSTQAPYHPTDVFPEYPFSGSVDGCEPNHAYRAVRGALELLGLDREKAGTADWNPLGSVLQPGQTVVLKPNFVRDFRESNPDHGNCLITHGAVIRAAVDYAYIALQGKGRLIIADAPQNDADFEAIRGIAGLDEIRNFYQREAGFEIEVYDLRPERARKIDGVIVGHVPLPGDPAGYVKVDLGRHSAFTEINHLCHLLYGAEYDTRELRRHHHDDVHEYLISKTVLDADCVISLPKLKTHKKVGLTVNMKNLVGINGNKNWLPHHREGTPAQGGDQFPDDRLKHRVERAVVACFKRVFPKLGPLRAFVARPIKAAGKSVFGDTNNGAIRSGNWHGNDTTWRMVIDLNRILLYAKSDGTLSDRRARNFFSIVDGIIGGEGNGPLDPTPKPSGIVLAGTNPVAVDTACARVMGFDCRRLPLLCHVVQGERLSLAGFGLDDVIAHSNAERFDRALTSTMTPTLAFEPHAGWKGYLDIGSRTGD